MTRLTRRTTLNRTENNRIVLFQMVSMVSMPAPFNTTLSLLNFLLNCQKSVDYVYV